MKVNSKLFVTWAATWLVLVNGAVAEDDDLAKEMKKLEGRFERVFLNGAGVRFRTVKEEREGKSLVTTYDDVGNVVEAHTSEYKIEKRGPVRVFSFFNVTVTAGPQKGLTHAGTSTYIYRADEKGFAEVWGMLEGDERPPQMLVWRRMGEGE